MAVSVIITLFPFVWMLSTSFKSPGEIFTKQPTILPQLWTLGGYKDLFAALFSKIPSLLSLFHSERYNATESCKVLQDKRDLCALCALA